MTTTSATLAARFLETANADAEPVTNLKLQKLVTLAQSLNLYRFGVPIIGEPIQAWDNGPAVKPLYGIYKSYGRDPITVIDKSWKSKQELAESASRVAREVWSLFGGLTASQLWTLTHKYGPYEAYYIPGVADIVIPNQRIGAAWQEYKGGAHSLRHLSDGPREVLNLNVELSGREPVDTPMVGWKEVSFTEASEYDRAASQFTPSRLHSRGA